MKRRFAVVLTGLAVATSSVSLSVAGSSPAAADHCTPEELAANPQACAGETGPFVEDFIDIRQVRPVFNQPRFRRGGSRGSFISRCGRNENNHRNSDNFIVSPGVTNGAHHLHDYVGNLSTDAFSTDESLAAAGTTCRLGDKSTYFWPVLRAITPVDQRPQRETPQQNSQNQQDQNQNNQNQDVQNGQQQNGQNQGVQGQVTPDQAGNGQNQGVQNQDNPNLSNQNENRNFSNRFNKFNRFSSFNNRTFDRFGNRNQNPDNGIQNGNQNQDQVQNPVQDPGQQGVDQGQQAVDQGLVQDQGQQQNQGQQQGADQPQQQQGQQQAPQQNAGEPGGAADGNVGRILRPTSVIIQFRGNPVSRVSPMPRFIRVITGDARAATNGGANARAQWTCTGFTNRITTQYPLCPRGSQVVRIADFPSCWDGVNTDSANHRTHIVFPDQNGRCPQGTRAVPQLRIILTYRVPPGRSFALDSFPEQLHNPITDHNDFVNVMPERLMNFVVACINSGRHC